MTRNDTIRFIVREWMEKNLYLPVHDGPFSLQHFGIYHKEITGIVANTLLDEARGLK
ncbi:hypothetical protein EVB74_007 [Rhizobium phage RHph_Y3_56_1]|nr:hypothetical protein EVB59_007 [Rhizobium phage RHph_Y3_1]QIG77955.1 hypothetical protein EVB74_007 [Rhizobium phage RHph_Y3_56_1]